MPGGRWTCGRCGATNAATLAGCQACGSLRGSVVVAEVDAAPDRRPAAARDPARPGAPAPGPGATEQLDRLVEIRGSALVSPLLAIAYTRVRIRERGPRMTAAAVLVTAIGLPVLGALLAVAGASAAWLVLPIVLLGPLLLGVAASVAMPGVAGWTLSLLGAVAAGAVIGLIAWLSFAAGDGDGATDPLQGPLYIALIALILPVLTAVQLGVGVMLGGVLSALRRRAG